MAGRRQRDSSPWVGPAATGAALLAVVAVLVPVGRESRRTTVGFPELAVAPSVTVVLVVVLALALASVPLLAHPVGSTSLAAAIVVCILPLLAGVGGVPGSVRAALAGVGVLVVPLVVAPLTGRVPGVPLVGALLALAWHVATYEPFDLVDCSRTCERAGALLADHLPSGAGIGTRVGAVVLVGLLAAAVAVGRRGAGSAGTAAVLTALALTTAAAVLDQVSAEPHRSVLASALRLAGVLVIGLVAISATLRSLAVRRRLRTLADPASRGASTSTGLCFRMPGSDAWVDPHGRPVPPSADLVAVVQEDGRPVVGLAHGTGSAPPAVTPELDLALRNARWEAVLRHRVADLRSSLQRVVATFDDERRGLERDLHDGTQQRLVSAALHLRLAATEPDPVPPDDLARAEEGVRRALAELREVSHGVFPRARESDGLGAALADLADDLDVEVDVSAEAEGSPPAVAAAAYAVVQAAVAGRASGDRAQVSIGVEDDAVVVTVALSDPVATGALEDAADRVGARGGSLHLDREGRRVRAVIPCE